MKFSNPQFVVVETAADVQTKRDASGEVFDIGETEMQGIANSTPTGRRRYANEILAYEAFLGMELGYPVSIIARPEPDVLPPTKTKPLKPKQKKAKPAVKKPTNTQLRKAKKAKPAIKEIRPVKAKKAAKKNK